MKSVDSDGAYRSIVKQLAAGLAQDLYYHGLHHTVNDVVPAVERLAAQEGVDGEDLILVKTAAYFHDSGYLHQYYSNEPVAVRVVREELPKFGFRSNQIEHISQIVMATKLPQRPKDLLGQILCDGDLDSLGRDDFFITSHYLRLELIRYGDPTTLREWYERQLTFLKEHEYFTASARSLRAAGKQKNIEEIEAVLIPGR